VQRHDGNNRRRCAVFCRGLGLRRPAHPLVAVLWPRRRLALVVYLLNWEPCRPGADWADKARGVLRCAEARSGLHLRLHIADRFRSLSRGQANSEILEAGLILIVAISIVSVGPAFFRDGAELIREHTLPLLLAALATGLCIFERSYAQRTKSAEIKSQ
jgi:hypothetical protein